MASNQPDRPQSTSDYGRMKRNVANSLTVVDTLNIATIFNFSTASIDELESKRAPGFLLLRILEQHGILGESKVDELEDALREVNLEMAVRHLHRYKESLPIPRIPRHPSESSLASEDSGIAASGCHSQVLSLSELDLDCQPPPAVEAFCNHCNQVITWRSAASEHASHNHAIIAGEKLTVEVAKRKMEICTELDSITEKMKTTQGAVEDQMHHGRLPKMVEEVERLAKEFQEKVETRKRELIDHLSRSEAERSSQIEDYRKDVKDMLGLCGSVKKELTASSDDVGLRDSDCYKEADTSSVSHLIHLNNMKKKLAAKRHRINAKLKDVQETRSRTFLTKTPNDGHFAELLESTLSGIIWILTDQVVMVFDERRTIGHIEIKCYEGPNSEVECWSKLVETSQLDGSVVVSAIEYYNGPYPHLLLAAGRTVYMLRLSYDGNHFDGISDTKSYEMKMEADDAYITAISAHEQGSQHRDHFVVANSHSLNIFQYNGLCELEREFTSSLFLSSILSISCVNDMVAVVDNLSKNLLIFKSDGNVTTLVTTVGPSICGAQGAIPWSVLWTGALWLILWVPDSEGVSKWWVSSHHENGGNVKLYDGEFSRLSFPVAISRFIYGIMVSFCDSSLHRFEQS